MNEDKAIVVVLLLFVLLIVIGGVGELLIYNSLPGH